jgi:hypothetical protein
MYVYNIYPNLEELKQDINSKGHTVTNIWCNKELQRNPYPCFS